MLASLAGGAAGQTRTKAEEYPAHAAAGKADLGAEYLVHSLPSGTETFFVADYLVLDVGVFPKGEINLRQGDFRLRINGSISLTPIAPEMMAFAIRAGDFQTAASGDPNGTVTRRQPQERFPGDPQARVPVPPRAPDPNRPNGPPARETANAAAIRMALPEGRYHGPEIGFLYFPYEGKTKKIKSLELLYAGDAGEATLKIF